MNRECTDLEFLPVPFHPPLPARLHRLQFLRFGSFARGILNGLTQFKESAIISLEQKYHFHPPLAVRLSSPNHIYGRRQLIFIHPHWSYRRNQRGPARRLDE
jgi:hypothetical protein